MGFVEINPAYRHLGLAAAEDFLALPGLIISGHPDRNVARVELFCGAGSFPAILKREHRVLWRTRLRNACDGFGLVSRSSREAAVLRHLAASGVGCAEWMAHGEDGRGRAFLLLRELPETVELREYLQQQRGQHRRQRLSFARRLGEALANLHNAGVDQPDLYPKHVRVRPRDESIAFLDFQRSRLRGRLNAKQRTRDLAALDASLSEALATDGERLACLQSYRDSCGWNGAASAIRAMAARLLRYRHVRAERRLSPPKCDEGVFWIDGERFCVTSGFWAAMGDERHTWIELFRDALRFETWGGRRLLHLPGGGRATLQTGTRTRPLTWLWNRLRGRPLISAEVRRAGQLFIRQVRGEAGPRLLAFGQSHSAPWRTESFLLTEDGVPEGGPV
jgi:tRNA A-37 threonylcarbamoyl transferase component Bud32